MSSSSASSSSCDVLIIGAGPTGLGAAARLAQRGRTDWRLVDARAEAGGLAYTTVTPEGFLFDTGGHVIFSHYQFFDDLLDAAAGSSGPDRWNTRRRVSHVLCCGTWVPYPFQNNLSFLPLATQERCLLGAIDAGVRAATATAPPRNFDEWILRVMGEGIAEVFMRPYNFKVWAVPPSEMQCGWLGERVATVDAKRLVSDCLHKRAAEVAWGPNAEFRFPARGGTGQIWKDVARKCCGGRAGLDKMAFRTKVVSVDVGQKEVTVEEERGGKSIRRTIKYNRLISTMPLDLLLGMCDKETQRHTIDTWFARERVPPLSGTANATDAAATDATAAAPRPPRVPTTRSGLFHSSSHIVGLGIRGTHNHGDKCWQYFPDDNCPFYRSTVFTNYSRHHAPADDVVLPTIVCGDLTVPSPPPPSPPSAPSSGRAGPYWSLMLEVSESFPHKPVDTSLVNLSGGSGGGGGGSSGGGGGGGGGGGDGGSGSVANSLPLRLPRVVVETIRGAVRTGLIRAEDEIVSIHYEGHAYGYPTPSLGRDAALASALPYLRERDVWSRGRFGAWKYEVANQDHSCMQGVEAVDNMLDGAEELTVHKPAVVNAKGGKNMTLRFVLPGADGGERPQKKARQ